MTKEIETLTKAVEAFRAAQPAIENALQLRDGDIQICSITTDGMQMGVHVYYGIEVIAEHYGAEIQCIKRKSKEVPWELRFIADGVMFFQIERDDAGILKRLGIKEA